MSAETETARPRRRRGSAKLLSYVLATLGLGLCVWSIWSAARTGLARMYASYGAITKQLPAVDRAVRLGPSDPDVHYLRASVLADAEDLDGKVKEYERAVALRPLDYILWLELGDAREEAGDVDRAITAYKEAARLAPAYSKPRWRLGNLLLRAGRTEEAFAEMRLASTTQPSLLPNFIDLVWGVQKGDAESVNRVVRPETDAARLALARFFVKHGKAQEALAIFRAVGNARTEEERALLADLLGTKRFTEAYEVWKNLKEKQGSQVAGGVGLITDGSFEGTAKVNEPGFGWQMVTNNQAIRPLLDKTEPRAGANSLMIDWRGESDAGTIVLSQLVLVEKGTRYRLSYAFRTKDLSTGGPPVLVISDASSADARELVHSGPLPQETSGWQQQAIDFRAGEETLAVLIKLVRQNCSTQPCPVFGRAWLDDFSLQKIH